MDDIATEQEYQQQAEESNAVDIICETLVITEDIVFRIDDAGTPSKFLDSPSGNDRSLEGFLEYVKVLSILAERLVTCFS